MAVRKRVYFDTSRLDDVIRAAYEFSRPQGLGWIHAKAGGLADDELNFLKAHPRGNLVVSMDYVSGRAVKLSIFKVDDGARCYFNIGTIEPWYDHPVSALKAMLAKLGLEITEEEYEEPAY